MKIDGHVFCGVSICQYDPRLDGERFIIADNRVAILTGSPWPDEDTEIVVSRVAIFKPIEMSEEVSEDKGTDAP